MRANNLKNIGWTIVNLVLLLVVGAVPLFAQDAGSSSGGSVSGGVSHSSTSTTTTTTSGPDLPSNSNTWLWIAVAAIAFLILIVILARSGSSRRVERHTTVVK